jgi:hypothetical protein
MSGSRLETFEVTGWKEVSMAQLCENGHGMT